MDEKGRNELRELTWKYARAAHFDEDLTGTFDAIVRWVEGREAEAETRGYREGVRDGATCEAIAKGAGDE